MGRTSREDTVTSSQTQTSRGGFDGEITIYTNPRIPIIIRRNPKPGEERRSSNRLTAQLEITIFCGSVAHKTKSLDISLGGLKLKDRIPNNFIGKTLDVFISDPSLPPETKNKTIALKARSVDEYYGESLMFEQIDQIKSARVVAIMEHLRKMSPKT